MALRDFPNLNALAACAGQAVGASDWLTITQEQIQLFAQATGDHQWIHVDVEKAKQGPFGAPIAHGFLTLSLIPQFFASAIAVGGVKMGVNYGLNKVRFTAPVPVGSRLRAHLRLLEALPIANNGMQLRWEVKVEREGADKPVCIAESLALYYA